MSMLCRQCEQTAGGTGCSKIGVCGKDESVAALQDLLIYVLQGISVYSSWSRVIGLKSISVDATVREGLFTTVTNVDFDAEHIAAVIRKACVVKEDLKNNFLESYKKEKNEDFTEEVHASADFVPADTIEGLIDQGMKVGIMADPDLNEDIRSLREILLYGLKGTAAYADHAAVLGYRDEGVDAFFVKALSAIGDDSLSADELIGLNMECGTVNLKCLKLLDQANTETYGHPEPTKVSLGIKRGPAIIVSGHDLHDIKLLLEQTEGKGINIYTHGEMLPTLAYPELKKYSHFVGHFGTAWQNQQKEFDGVPAAFLFTTNCIQKPKDSYKDNVFTTGLVRFPGCVNIEAASDGSKDFSQVISKALELGGFAEDKEGKEITIGFGHNTILGVAPKVVEAVKSGAIKHFFLVGGCDGAKPGRNYYTELVEKTPQDTVVLTLACGKFRFNTLDLGDINGIPRLLDCGQCNDAYSAIVVASALAEAFNCSVNELPLTMILSWYEQKAVCILLTLLSLGIQNIKLGPSLPAFVTPNVLNVLVEKFNIAPISTPDEDLAAALG